MLTSSPPAETWPPWTDASAVRVAEYYNPLERRLLEAIERTRLELSRRPRLAEITARVPVRDRPALDHTMARLLLRGRVAKCDLDGQAVRDVEEKPVPKGVAL